MSKVIIEFKELPNDKILVLIKDKTAVIMSYWQFYTAEEFNVQELFNQFLDKPHYILPYGQIGKRSFL